MAVAQLSITFFLQMAVILATCRVVGWLGRKYLKQPQVVCEMIAGVLLGPSLFGLVAPEIQKLVFTPENQGVLYVGAQLGVGLYMFVVGLTFSTDRFKANVREAAAVSIAGMVVPFAVAVAATPWLMRVPGLFAAAATRFDATLFTGAAVAITAFPMLARIIHERGLTHTLLGTLSLSAGAIDDAAAWCVLAVVLASFGSGGSGVAYAAVLGGMTRVHDLRDAAATRAARALGGTRGRRRQGVQRHHLCDIDDAVHAERLHGRLDWPARDLRRLPAGLRGAARRAGRQPA